MKPVGEKQLRVVEHNVWTVYSTPRYPQDKGSRDIVYPYPGPLDLFWVYVYPLGTLGDVREDDPHFWVTLMEMT